MAACNGDEFMLPPGIAFDRTLSDAIIPEWKGKVLFISVNDNQPELENVYKDAIIKHNKNVDQLYPDSGFDLFLPDELPDNERHTRKIDFGIQTAMFESLNAICDYEYKVSNPLPFYLYPRSSISKTRVRLANNVGIIDSGYRVNIGGYFDILPPPPPPPLTTTILEKHQRVIQICSNNLEKFKVVFIKNIESLGETERGAGGFGSTGV